MYGRFLKARAQAAAGRAPQQAPEAIRPPVSFRDHEIALAQQRRELTARLTSGESSEALKAAESQVAELQAQNEALKARIAELEAEKPTEDAIVVEESAAEEPTEEPEQSAPSQDGKSVKKPQGRSGKSK